MALTEEEKKERNRINQRKWYAENKVKAKIKRHDRYIKNKEKILQQCKRYREENKDTIRAKDRNRRRGDDYKKKQAKWRLDNKAYMRDYLHEYYRDNKLTINKKNAEWKKNNPERCRLINKRYFQEQKDTLTDSYIKSLIVQKNSLTRKDIPQSLIAAKRAELQFTRLIKDQENG